MPAMTLLPFQPEQAAAVSALICRNLMEVNIQDYSPSEMQAVAAGYTPQKVLEMSRKRTMLVASQEGRLLGTAALEPDRDGEAGAYYVLSVFVLPEAHGQGVGRALMQALEDWAQAHGGRKLGLSASLTAVGFYEKLGYVHQGPLTQEGLFEMCKQLL